VRLLLDTNALICWLSTFERLQKQAVDAIRDPHNEIHVSVVAAWEMAIKVASGRLPVPPDLAAWLPERLARERFQSLDVRLEHVLRVEHLPRHHGDPFDRLLIAQAQLEGLTIVTSDESFDRYNVAVLHC